MIKKTIILSLVLFSSQAAFAGLESPADNVTKSGIGLIRGWVCDANEVTVSIDGGDQISVVYGNLRGDTLGICGDANNGFELLVNWNDFGEGQHTITAYVDGQAINTHSFNIITLGLTDEDGKNILYARGLSGNYTLKDFPEIGKSTEISWSEADQNFAINAINDISNPDECRFIREGSELGNLTITKIDPSPGTYSLADRDGWVYVDFSYENNLGRDVYIFAESSGCSYSQGSLWYPPGQGEGRTGIGTGLPSECSCLFLYMVDANDSTNIITEKRIDGIWTFTSANQPFWP